MELENFPTSEAAQRMLDTISPIYDKSYVAKWLFQSVGEEYDGLWNFVEEILLQRFPETATWGLSYWEQRYHIPVNDRIPLDQRRERIITMRKRRRLPMNTERMEEIASSFTGRMVEVREFPNEYRFEVAVYPGAGAVSLQALIEELARRKPSHLQMDLLFENYYEAINYGGVAVWESDLFLISENNT